MWAAAKVDEFASGVEGNDRLFGLFLDQLTFKDLIGLFVELERLRFGNEFPFVGEVLGGQLVHFGFDFCQIVGSKRFITQKFVEEAGVDRRTDAEFYVGIQLHHSGGEKMRRGMAEDEQCVGIFFGEYLELDVVVERAAQVD